MNQTFFKALPLTLTQTFFLLFYFFPQITLIVHFSFHPCKNFQGTLSLIHQNTSRVPRNMRLLLSTPCTRSPPAPADRGSSLLRILFRPHVLTGSFPVPNQCDSPLFATRPNSSSDGFCHPPFSSVGLHDLHAIINCALWMAAFAVFYSSWTTQVDLVCYSTLAHKAMS